MTSKEFEQVVVAKEEPQLSEAFCWLCGKVYDHMKIKMIDRDDAIQDGVMFCYEKLPRYNPEKKVAFNFFTTTVLCLYRQTAPRKNYNELKEKYKDLNKTKTSHSTTSDKKTK